MQYSEFMSFCGQAMKICRAAATKVATANVEALAELRELAVRLYRHMEITGTLGAHDRRFRVRMWLHLQYMTVKSTLHVSPGAMTAFKEATEVFMMRIPEHAVAVYDPKPEAAPAGRTPARSSRKTPPARKTARKSSRDGPKVTCYLCVTPGHYCNNPKFHKKDKDGKYPMPSDSMKKQICTRVDGADVSTTEKTDLKTTIKDFWDKRCAA